MKIGIVGESSFNDYNGFNNFIILNFNTEELKEINTYKFGNIDLFVEEFCKTRKIKINYFEPDFSKYGSNALYYRFIEIQKNSDKIISFGDITKTEIKQIINVCKIQGKELLLCQ